MGSTVVNAGGFLVPGPIGTPSSMTVAGDLTIQRNAVYVVQVNPRTASSTNVSGSASLDGTVAAVFFPGLYLARSYTILTADNRPPPHEQKSKRVNVNRANAAELRQVPGMGEAHAEAIVRHRPAASSATGITSANCGL